MINRLLVIASICLLQACATPIGKFKESDMAWTKGTVDISYQQVYRNLQEGFRKCFPMLFVEGSLYPDINKAHFDIHLVNMFGSRTAWVFGVVDINYMAISGSPNQ